VDAPAAPAPAVPRPNSLLKALADPAETKMIEQIGARLHDFLFDEPISTLYRTALRTLNEGELLPLRLCLNHRSLAFLPWETLYDQKSRRHISHNGLVPFARVAPDSLPGKINPARPLRILGMVSYAVQLGTIKLGPLEEERERSQINAALKKLHDSGQVDLRWTATATQRELMRMLGPGAEGDPWDVWHFIGHGGFCSEKQMGYIVIEAPGGGDGVPLFANKLVDTLFATPNYPKLVVLNSCSGAQSEAGELFSSTAIHLIRNGIPAVIAMQFDISNKMAVDFSECFYTHLADGHSIATAMVNTRIELNTRQVSEWVSPVLYLNTADGPMIV
jgi:hypothetical protein